ncbi:hypothetical protein ACPEIC_45755 [Stenotrophomonas sp. NPDC087984]
MEHLTDAAFIGERAVSPGEAGQKGSALRKLPGGGLEIALWEEEAFGHIDPVHVRNAALDLVRTIENDLEEEAVEHYLALVEEVAPYEDE